MRLTSESIIRETCVVRRKLNFIKLRYASKKNRRAFSRFHVESVLKIASWETFIVERKQTKKKEKKKERKERRERNKGERNESTESVKEEKEQKLTANRTSVIRRTKWPNKAIFPRERGEESIAISADTLLHNSFSTRRVSWQET